MVWTLLNLWGTVSAFDQLLSREKWAYSPSQVNFSLWRRVEVTAQKKRRWKKAREKSRELSHAPDWTSFRCFIIKHRNYNKHTSLFSGHCLSLCEQFVCSLCHNHQKNLVKPTSLSKNPLFYLEYVKTATKIINRRGFGKALHAFSRARDPRFLARTRIARVIKKRTRRKH